MQMYVLFRYLKIRSGYLNSVRIIQTFDIDITFIFTTIYMQSLFLF